MFGKMIHLYSLAVAVLLLFGCEMNQQLPEFATTARVSPSSSYLVYFGPAPTVPTGSYLAMVGFLPLANDFSKVGPLPLFLSATPDTMLRLAQRLVSLDPGSIEPLGLINPFPRGTVVMSLRHKDDLVMIDLSRQAARQKDFLYRRAMVMSLGHLMSQFPGVKRVMVSADGVPLTSFGGLTFRPSPLQVVSPGGPPHPVGVLGSWDKNGNQIEEIAVYFDRPVTISNIELIDDAGRGIKGHPARQPFDMGLVMRLQAPPSMREGTRLHVAWKAVDALGDAGHGESVFHLRRASPQAQQ